MSKPEKGFRHIINCGEDVERIEIIIYGKKQAFKKQKETREIWTKGTLPMRIILEDSAMFNKPF